MRRSRPVNNVDDADDEQRAPHIDDSQLLKPLTLTLGRPATLSVDVSGVPPPIVQWLVGRRRVKDSSRLQMKVEGQRHTLMVSKVADNMALGVHVVAKNDVGEDSCMIDIRTIEDSDNINENDDDNSASHINHYHRQQQPQQTNGVADDAAIVKSTDEDVNDTADVSRDSTGRRSLTRRKRVQRVRAESDSKSLKSLDSSATQEVPQDRLNATEDLSMSIDDPALLNRSYDTARAGRRTRSAAATARSSGRRSRVRPVATTTTASDDGNQGTSAMQDGASQDSGTGDTSEVPQDRLNVTEDFSATTGDPALLNRSYDTAIAGRRARSAAAAARSSGRRSRVRPAAATTPAADDANKGTSALQDGGSQNNDTSEVPRDRLNKSEDLSASIDDAASLNRSYDTAKAGRRTRSAAAAARSSGRRSRVRPDTSTSSMPAVTTEAADAGAQVMAVQHSDGQANDTGDTSGLQGRRRRRRRTEQDTEKDSSVAAESLELTVDSEDQPVNGGFATPADSNLLDIGSPRQTETVKTKKRRRKKSRGSTEALTEESTVGKESDPDLSISKDFSPSLQVRTSSPVQVFSFESQPVPGTTKNTVAETERDPNLWMICDTRLNDLCKQLLADQNFDKLSVDDSLKRISVVDDLRETEVMEDPIKYKMRPTSNISQPETTVELPINARSQENQIIQTVLPVMDESPIRRKTAKHKKKVEAAPAEQQTEAHEKDSRVVEDSSQFSVEPDTDVNRNVPNISYLGDTTAYNYEAAKRKKRAEDMSEKQLTEIYENDSRVEVLRQFATDTTSNKNVPNVLSLRVAEAYNAEPVKHIKQPDNIPTEKPDETFKNDREVDKHSTPTENKSLQLSVKSNTAENRNVPNILYARETKPVKSSPQVEVRGMPDIILSSPTPEPVIQAQDETPDNELEILEREPGKSMEERKFRQEQRQKKRLAKEEQARIEKEIQEQQEREREKTEKRERKQQEKEEKERQRKERQERKDLEKQQREMMENEPNSDEPRQVQKYSERNGSQTVSKQSSERTTEVVDISIKKPVVSPRTITNVNIEIKARDPYENIPMVDDIVDEENIPPVDYGREDLTPVIEKSSEKKPPSGRKMPPRSPLFPVPVPAKPEDSSPGEPQDELTYFRVTPPRTTLKEVKARDRESSARQRSRSADRFSPHDRGQSRRTGSHFTVVDIDIESAPEDSVPASLSASFDGGQPYSASSPVPPDFVTRRNLRPARSEEMLFVKKLSSRSPTPSYGSNDSSVSPGDGGQWIRTAKSIDCLNRSLADSEFSVGLGRRSLSREWKVVTTTTKEEIVFVKGPEKDMEERKRIKQEYEKNKQMRERSEQLLTKEREKIERERLERLLAELRRRRQKERQQLLEKKMAEKKAKEENDRFIRQAIEEQRQKRLEEDKARREEEQKKRDELNEKWRKEKEQREQLSTEKQEKIDRERQEKLVIERQFQLQVEEKERQEREAQARRARELEEKREKEAKERQERQQKLEQERQRREKLAQEEKLKQEQMEREAKLLRERTEKEQMEKEARRREEEQNRLEKERQMVEKLANEHRLKLEKLEEETKLQQKQLATERLEREETQRILREKIKKETVEQEEIKRLEMEEQKRMEEEQKKAAEKQKAEKRDKDEKKKLELARREKEALERIIQEQKLRLENLIIQEQKLRLETLEHEEKLRAEKMEKERAEKEEERLKRKSQERKENDSRVTPETDSVFDDHPSTSLLSPSSPVRRRIHSQDMATQTEDSSEEEPVVGEVRQYPAEVVTERLFSDSESPTSSPVPNTDELSPSPPSRPAGLLVKRAKSTGTAVDDDDNATPVVVHEYGELLSFWRGDPTDGRLTRARAKSQRDADTGEGRRATVHEFDFRPEQWSSTQLDPVDDEDDQSKSKRQQPPNVDDQAQAVPHDAHHPASSTDDFDINGKSVVHSTLSWIDAPRH